MRRLLIAFFLMFACLAPAAAQFAEATGSTPTKPVAGGPVAVGQTMAQVDPNSQKVAIIQAPPVVVAPAETSTSFSVGTWIADLLGGLAAIFGSVIGTFATKWIMALAKRAGIQTTQAMSDRLDAIVENGIHAGAAEAKKDLTGRLNVTTKNEVIARAVTYVQAHGASTIKDLSGLDVGDPKTVSALQARAAKALANIGPEKILDAPATTVTVTAPGLPPQTTTQVAAVSNGTPPT